MTPRRAHGYRRRDPKEIWIAIGVAAAIVGFTVFMIWLLGPHPKHVSPPPTPSTAKPAATTTTAAPTTTTG